METIEVHYFCPECDRKFVVYHKDDTRNTHCHWCSKEVRLTGKISRIEGDDMVTYQDGEEVERRLKPGKVPRT